MATTSTPPITPSISRKSSLAPSPISYSPENSPLRRQIDHIKLLFSAEIVRSVNGKLVQKNWLERVGDRGLSWIPSLSKADGSNQDRRLLTVAFAAFVLFCTIFMLYPIDTLQTMKAAQDFFLPRMPSLLAVEFWSCVVVGEITASYALRAAGRYTNKELLENFYKNNLS